MPSALESRIAAAIRSSAGKLWKINPPEVVLNRTPGVQFGELATPICLGLARTLQKAPRAIAEELVGDLAIDGVGKIEVAGPGYINFHFDRARVLADAAREVREGLPGPTPHTLFPVASGDGEAAGKVIVEHTNINPNKAAHIGHLRNAAIGDTFVRVLGFTGRKVEVQNYIDNTGVQVADVIVGFLYLEKKSVADVRALIAGENIRFDYYCWDLYARVASFYETEDPEFELRKKTLQEIEQGGSDAAEMAEAVAMTIVGCHLATMSRINVRYDVLPRESDILHLHFWDRAFGLLKERKAIFLQTEGKNLGCWVMRVDTESGAEDKILVRSNGTVTYVGKDIAYQLWKLGLLDLDFHYRVFHRYPEGRAVWVTQSRPGEAGHPSFGKGAWVYNVIDVRQSYPQTVVKEGVRVLGFEAEADRSVHFSYEMVALTPACARQLGVVIPEEDRGRAYVEVSGRKGQGVKADDLLDKLGEKAEGEVGQRNGDLGQAGQRKIAHQIAVGALRYFLLRFTRTAVIAFDFDEALSFDGETGPYIQYAAVRAGNILKKAREDGGGGHPAVDVGYARLLAEHDDIWELVYTASRLDEIALQVADSMEPAALAKYAFLLAQKFSLFYHSYRVLSEEDPERRQFYLEIVAFVRAGLERTLGLMGIEVPERM
jgi:arginyl-tRNA synthetase